MKKAALILLLAALTLMGCRQTEVRQIDKNLLTAELDSLFNRRFQEGDPGAAVIVTHHDSIVYNHSFGMARLDTLVPITDHTMFNICSVSKQFSAVAILKLVEEGKLSLDDSVKKFFPNFRADFYNRITLRHLLTHTSGLPDARPRTAEQWKRYTETTPTRFTRVEDFKRFCEEDESCRFLEQLDTLEFEPGTRYAYQNPTFQLLLMVIEQVTGEQFDEWMRRNIFLPAGMTQTTYFEPDKAIPDMAHGYEPVGFTTLNGDRIPTDNPNNYFRSQDGRWEENDYGEASFFGTKADGGLYTTPLEFLKWDQALYHDRLISKASRQMAHTGYIATDIPETDYGLAFFIEHRPDHPQKIYHTGDNGGFLIFEGRIPSLDLFYLVFANRPDWERESTIEAMDQILLRTIKPED